MTVLALLAVAPSLEAALLALVERGKPPQTFGAKDQVAMYLVAFNRLVLR